jgi:hypothetical protein
MANSCFKGSSLEAVRRWPTDRAKIWVQAYVHDSTLDPRVLAILAVGSAVRDGVQSNDVDLLTIVDGHPADRQERPPLEVDLRTYPTDGIESKIRQGHDYLGWAAKFGVLLHEKNGFWSKMLSRINGRIPLPSEQAARERALIAHRHFMAVLEAGDKEGALEQVTSSLTHLARIELIQAAVYPASRPELPGQLAAVGRSRLSRLLSEALNRCAAPDELLNELEPEMRRPISSRHEGCCCACSF